MDMFQCILYSWFYGIGILNLQILSDILDVLEKDELDMEEGLRFTHALCNFPKRDIAVFYLLTAGLTEKQPDTLSNFYTADEAYIQAILQKKPILAWALLRTQWDEKEIEIWETIYKNVDEKVGTVLKRVKENEFVREHFLWESRALAILCATGKVEWSTPNYVSPTYITEETEKWKSLEGKRGRRHYKIRTEALQYGVKRSNELSNQSSLGEIREPFRYLQGSPYWEGVREDIGVKWSIIPRNDELKESFYDLYFPDDIPDEWSLKDQEKSHGYGIRVQTSTDEIQERKHVRNFFAGYTSMGLLSWTSDTLSKYTCGKGGFLKIYNENQEIWKRQQSTWDLRPRKKKIRIPE